MPRTTQTAKKTTSAPAQVVHLDPRTVAVTEAAKKAAKTTKARKAKAVRTRSNAKRAPTNALAPVWVEAPPRRDEVIGVSPLACTSFGSHSCPRQVCMGCHSGGLLLWCDTCDSPVCYRTVDLDKQNPSDEYACLTVSSGYEMKDIVYRCIRCHVVKEARKDKTPYVVSLLVLVLYS